MMATGLRSRSTTVRIIQWNHLDLGGEHLFCFMLRFFFSLHTKRLLPLTPSEWSERNLPSENDGGRWRRRETV